MYAMFPGQIETKITPKHRFVKRREDWKSEGGSRKKKWGHGKVSVPDSGMVKQRAEFGIRPALVRLDGLMTLASRLITMRHG
jgi:hypothetical protein